MEPNRRILLKSRDATYSSSSTRETYTFALSNVRLAGKYRVSGVSCCYSWYNVNSSNNTVYTSLGNATLTSGQYSASTFTTMLQTALQVANAGYTAAYNTDTKKITIANATPFTLNFATTTNTAAYLMGFALSNTASGTSATGDYAINLMSTPSLLMEFDGVSDTIAATSALANNRANLYLPLNNDAYGDYVCWFGKDLNYTLNFPASGSVSRVIINMWDGSGNPLNLNRADFEVLLEAC